MRKIGLEKLFSKAICFHVVLRIFLFQMYLIRDIGFLDLQYRVVSIPFSKNPWHFPFAVATFRFDCFHWNDIVFMQILLFLILIVFMHKALFNFFIVFWTNKHLANRGWVWCALSVSIAYLRHTWSSTIISLAVRCKMDTCFTFACLSSSHLFLT